MTMQIAPAVIEKEKMMAFAQTYDNLPPAHGRGICEGIPFRCTDRTGRYVFYVGLGEVFGRGFFGQELLSGKASITKLLRRNAKNGLVEITIEAYNQNGDLVLTDVTEAIVKCRPGQNGL